MVTPAPISLDTEVSSGAELATGDAFPPTRFLSVADAFGSPVLLFLLLTLPQPVDSVGSLLLFFLLAGGAGAEGLREKIGNAAA